MKPLVLLASLVAAAPAFANDVDPFGFEKEHFVSTMTRAEALARSKASPRPAMYIDDAGRLHTPPSTKSREQVKAETLEAVRLGLTRYSVLGPVEPTAEQQLQIEFAGRRAIARSADSQ